MAWALGYPVLDTDQLQGIEFLAPSLAVIASEQFVTYGLSGVEGMESVSVVNVGNGTVNLSEVNGLLIYAPNGTSINFDVSNIVAKALEVGIPILGSSVGMHLLNMALGGDSARCTPEHASEDTTTRRRNSIFLALGTKVSSTIGGSGWLSINCEHQQSIAQKDLAHGAMTAAIADDRIIEAFEIPGHRWVIGVQWDVFGATRLPSGFNNVWLAFIERLVGK